MDENFTTKADTVYLASVSQEKKIIYLERQLRNSELYSKTLQKSLEANQQTIDRLVKDRSNHQVLTKLTESLYKLQKRFKDIQMQLKDSNAKLLIEMQLRIQQKAEYYEKMGQLQQMIIDLRKSNKDKDQEFTIIVNKLRMYEDIRQLALEQKIAKTDQKNLLITNRFKEEMLSAMAEQLNQYKKERKDYQKDIDQKLEILEYALESETNYQQLKTIFINQKELLQEKKPKQSMKHFHTKVQHGVKSKSSIKTNYSNLQLIKQIKRLVISNRMLEEGLNESVQKNEQLLCHNEILVQANFNLQERLKQYQNERLSSYLRNKGGSNDSSGSVKMLSAESGMSFSKKEIKGNSEVKDDLWLNNVENGIEEARLKRYLNHLKSQDYAVNVEELGHDVGKISEFLILSLQKQNRSRTRQSSVKSRLRSLSESPRASKRQSGMIEEMEEQDQISIQQV